MHRRPPDQTFARRLPGCPVTPMSLYDVIGRVIVAYYLFKWSWWLFWLGVVCWKGSSK